MSDSLIEALKTINSLKEELINNRKTVLDEVKAKFMSCKGEVRRVGMQIVEGLK